VYPLAAYALAGGPPRRPRSLLSRHTLVSPVAAQRQGAVPIPFISALSQGTACRPIPEGHVGIETPPLPFVKTFTSSGEE